MSLSIYNNFGTGALAIVAVLNECKSLPIAKVTLIFPIISHSDLLNYLSHSSAKVKSLDKLIVEKTMCFSNFNKRYYDSLSSTFNALQYLHDLGYVEFTENEIYLIKPVEYSPTMGKRTKKIFLASKNLSSILNDLVEKLYLNLRIEL